MRSEHVLRTRLRVDRARPEVFAFFGEAANLEAITPPELRFRTLTPLPIAMRVGAVIDYALRLHGVRIRWRTRISEWSPHDGFEDEQIAGPYAVWIHTHRFRDVGPDKTEIEDEVRYTLPFAPMGELAGALVAWQLRRIFRYRAARVRELLSPESPARAG